MSVIGIKITHDSTEKIKKSFELLMKKDVLVGIPSDGIDREDSDDANNAEIGYMAEFGCPEKNIPERSWLQPGIVDGKKDIEKYLQKAATFAIEGNSSGVDTALRYTGETAKNSVKAKVVNGPFQELAKYTLAQRKKRGVTRESPLIDTGQFLNSINYVIREK